MIQTEDQLLKNLDLYYQLCSIEVSLLAHFCPQWIVSGHNRNPEHHVCLSGKQRHQSTDRRVCSADSFCQARTQSHVHLRHVRLFRPIRLQIRRSGKKRRVRRHRRRHSRRSLDEDLLALALDALVLVASRIAVHRRIHQKISLPRL